MQPIFLNKLYYLLNYNFFDMQSYNTKENNKHCIKIIIIINKICYNNNKKDKI